MKKNIYHLTVEEIVNKVFTEKPFGYDPGEVDKFLDLVIKDKEVAEHLVDSLQVMNSDLNAKIIKLQNMIEEQENKISLLREHSDQINQHSYNNRDQ